MIIYGGVAKSTESPPSKRNRLMTREIHFQTHARARRSQTLRRTRGPAVYCDPDRWRTAAAAAADSPPRIIVCS